PIQTNRPAVTAAVFREGAHQARPGQAASDKGVLVFRGTNIGSAFTPLVLALGLFGAACSSGSAPTAAPPSAPAASAPSSGAASNAQAPAAGAPGSGQSPAASAPSAAPADAPASGGELRFTFEPGSQARYRAREQFVGAPLPN